MEATQAAQAQKEVKIGDYVLTGKIGQGGIAEIYKARQSSLDRDVAIKVLSSKLSSDPDLVRRFERESIVIAGLNHPNIVSVIDKGIAGSRYYFVMEYVDGTSLREVIDSTRVPLSSKLDMLIHVCKALDYAHKNGVIHRDIKPANILIDRQGNAMVADFGIAQIIATEGEMTSSDVIMGTLAYMSPEQKLSSTNVDHTTDLYAMGVILYEILVGKKPLGHFKLPSELDEKISPVFDEIIQKCLAQDSKDRYKSAAELKNAILEATAPPRSDKTDDFSMKGSESFMGKCRYLDTLKETRFSSTVLVENRMNKRFYVIKKHSRGAAGRKEAKILTSLKHKNIVNILGSGGDLKSTVVISEYAAGGSLAERMVRKYNWQKATEIVIEIASGLDFAHKNNIVHGNIRPSNVLFTGDEEVKISDFGLPTHYDAAGKKNWYCPPERKQSKHGDIYSLGVIYHQLLTGRNPQHDAGGNLRLDDIERELPADVMSMINKLLAIRVGHRYQTLEQMIFDWDDFEQRRQQKSSIREQPQKPEPQPQRYVPAWAIAAAVFGVASLLVTILYIAGILN